MDFRITSSYSSRVTTILYSWGTWMMLGMFALCKSSESDIRCLESIKDSLDDPWHRLSKWNFNNDTGGFFCNLRGVECSNTGEKGGKRVSHIKLQGMGLTGEFPRGIASCSNLVGLDLSHNNFYGAIPSDISRIFLSLLNILILLLMIFPVKFQKALQIVPIYAFLNFNDLTGQIPPEIELLYRLQLFNVASNLLSGPVMRFINLSVPSINYADNSGLCDGPFNPCSASQGQRQKYINNIHFTRGLLVGWALFTLLSFIVSFLYMPTMSAKKRMTKKKKAKATNSHLLQCLPSNARRVNDIDWVLKLPRHVPRMRFGELSKATDSFNYKNMIGVGKLGTIFKAVLQNGRCLAIKRFYVPQAFDQQFFSELMILGKLKHYNLVPLLGFCYESNHRLLIYKYMPNGNLYEFLISRRAKVKFIEWPIQVQFAVGIAKGLTWLHQNGVVHQNISSKCILLDKYFQPKISNFEAAKISNPDFSSHGLRIVVNVESWAGSNSSSKDVYDFGTVLIELITSKRFCEVIDCSQSFHGDFVELILQHLSEDARAAEFKDEVLRFVRVAVDCLQSNPKQRPTMFEVLEMLRNNTGRYAK